MHLCDSGIMSKNKLSAVGQ